LVEGPDRAKRCDLTGGRPPKREKIAEVYPPAWGARRRVHAGSRRVHEKVRFEGEGASKKKDQRVLRQAVWQEIGKGNHEKDHFYREKRERRGQWERGRPAS